MSGRECCFFFIAVTPLYLDDHPDIWFALLAYGSQREVLAYSGPPVPILRQDNSIAQVPRKCSTSIVPMAKGNLTASVDGNYVELVNVFVFNTVCDALNLFKKVRDEMSY